ncbi:hypothetical protein FPZ12_015025 [Amycolatopsis acidicola]|uniref:PPE domain-containing protein n=1 Tax=Amycolatopsis acidicola TaxID=2596893 RepID=A0A5N0V5J2_9PSEU|nr:hypothetical protein [Amycolatopsis acidicola]KAA9161074.1 hypothetical protein FPZ12_015025 [Amycolatopsis acidicola]
MTTFDSSQYDIPTLIAKLRDQRFDGYDAESLAREVEKFRGGGGTASMGDAVDALKQIAGALSHTDTTLRDQLKALGVTWESKAGGQASAVLADQAGFSSDANTKVAQAAQLIFEQGEAFSRTKNKLPDPDALRQGGGTYSATDSLFSLFGFETDHAKAVRGSIEAQAQAIDALNDYAHDTGDYLSSSQPVGEPQSMETFASPGAAAQSVGTPSIQPVPPVSSVPDTSPTVAAGAKDAPVAHSTPVVHQAPVSSAPAASAPTPAMGIVAPSSGSSATAPQSTAPSSTNVTPVTAPISGTSGGQKPGATGETQRPGGIPQGSGATQVGPGGSTLTPGGPVTGGPVTGGAPGGAPAGDRSASAWGKPGAVEGKPGGSGESSALGKGKVFGSSPISSSSTNVGPGLTNVRAAGVGSVAEGAPAIGAAGAGGATSGENERPGRGFGKNTDAGKRVHKLPVGDLPEEEEAQLAKKAAPEPPSRERTRSILEPAATQDGEEDGEHIRRFGVDDRDLFTDQRGVSPDVIGERAVPDDRP